MNEKSLILAAELEKTQKDFWNISRQTAEFLSMLIKIAKPKNVLEIGTSNGYSALWIADALKDVGGGGHLHTIEFWEKRQSISVKNLTDCNLADYVTFLHGSALDILPKLEFIPDLVFIDANKGEYIKYFNLFKDKLPKGSIILADNVISHAEKVVDFISAIENDERYQSQVLDLPAGLLMAYKLS